MNNHHRIYLKTSYDNYPGRVTYHKSSVFLNFKHLFHTYQKFGCEIVMRSFVNTDPRWCWRQSLQSNHWKKIWKVKMFSAFLQHSKKDIFIPLADIYFLNAVKMQNMLLFFSLNVVLLSWKVRLILLKFKSPLDSNVYLIPANANTT